MRVAIPLLLVVGGLALAGCGGGGSKSATTTAASGPVTINVEIKGGKPVGGIQRATAHKGDTVELGSLRVAGVVRQGRRLLPRLPGFRLLSDPWGRGWDLFGTRSFQPNFTFLTPHTIWYVQVVALVTGHIAGLGVAHDRAVGLFRTPRMALWTQYPMLVLMVMFTVGGLWVLSQA